MKRIACIAGALLLIATPYSGRAAGDGDRSGFNRHWYLQVQAGAAYTLGETSFGDLVSPAAALSAGYRFSPVWGLRFGLSGWQARGAWASPASPYDYTTSCRAMSRPRSIWLTSSDVSILHARSIPTSLQVSGSTTPSTTTRPLRSTTPATRWTTSGPTARPLPWAAWESA